VLPKSPIGQAVAYALANWEALVRYTEDGDLAIDNVIASYYTSHVRWRFPEQCFTSGPGLARSA
jgi:Transposase IS66 family